MISELDGRTAFLSEAICARLEVPMTPELRESVSFFVDSLAASLTLGDPDALTDQLLWQSRRLDVAGSRTSTRSGWPR